MGAILPSIRSPSDLRRLSLRKLEQLAGEMREALCRLLTERSAHFASNLGVVELCLALHTSFDFRRDRLIWDTGHQIYPHKLVTGRYEAFGTIRTKGGLMGYPNPAESPYDLFMTGHAGCSVACLLGLASGDTLRGDRDRFHVAVIGDGALPSGIVFEALNNASELGERILVVLNDNKMSICPRVGGMAQYLDRLRMNPLYRGLRSEVARVVRSVPLVGESAGRLLHNVKDALKAAMHGGMLFEELGFRYVGPVDGHNLRELRRYLEGVKRAEKPVLLHVLTEKGHGFQPAAQDPVKFHTPAPFQRGQGEIIAFRSSSSEAYTTVASRAVFDAMQADPRITVLTAAMCQGNNLQRVRDEIPQRFFDTGICESFAVAFAAGQAKAGLRPIVAIYSTFLQRAYDQIFQEVCLQNLPVVFLLDRAGLTGPDGPTHHGCFDLGYLRVFPNMVVMAPGDAEDLPRMLDWALQHGGPAAIRYPKATAQRVPRRVAPVELGRAEIVRSGDDGAIFCCGTLLPDCVQAAEQLRTHGLEVGVVNARFVKPLDADTLLPLAASCPWVLTVEEAALAGGFGSAVLEAACEAGIDTSRVRRLGIPDRFIEHAERGELLSDLGLDTAGIVRTCVALAARWGHGSAAPRATEAIQRRVS